MGKDWREQAKTGSLTLLGGLLAGLLLAGCGGGSSSSPAKLSLSTAGSITLPVPLATAQSNNPAPYSGTTTITVNRAASVTGNVTFSVSGVPAGVKAAFSLPSTAGTSTELTIQAGYPDPADPTFAKQIYPQLKDTDLTITATDSGGDHATATLTLKLVQEPAAWDLSFLDSTDTYLQGNTILTVTGTTPVSEDLAAYDVNYTSETPGTPVTLAVSGAPAGLDVVFDTTTVAIDYIHTVTFTAQPGLAAGLYGFDLTATYLGVTRTLPVVIDYSPDAFFISPLNHGVQVAAGGTVTLPLYLSHADAYFSSTQSNTEGDPLYVGQTLLSAVAPAGLQVGFADTNPIGLAQVPMTITAGSSVADGTYQVTLQATRTGMAAFSLPVTVSHQASSVPWVQTIEWGQTVLAPDLPLVAGKPALICVQLLAETAGMAAPSPFTVTLGATTYPLAGPATVPMSVTDGDLANCYTAVLPGAGVTQGMAPILHVGAGAPQTLAPKVYAATTMDLTLVPIIHAGITPDLPTDASITQGLVDFWPVQAVNLTHRAPYTTSTVIPNPPASGSSATDYSSDGWGQLLYELASLRIVDGSRGYYYGMFDPAFAASFQGSSVVGLSLLGDGVGLGIDETVGAEFQNPDYLKGSNVLNRDNAVMILVHEEGHALNLNHAPAGGAGAPQLNYPYAGAAIGTWGYDPHALDPKDPTVYYDIMSYANNPHWVSDWNYLAALGWLEGRTASGSSMATSASVRSVSDQWVVGGLIDPAGQVHLAPMIRVSCPTRPPLGGSHLLRITGSAGTREIRFGAAEVPDLPGYRHFAFAVPAAGTVASMEIQDAGGARLLRRAAVRPLVERESALTAAAAAGTLVAREQNGRLHLEWDAAAHPFVNVIHEGTSRTTLALHLTGGKADLPLDGLEAGGRFQIHYSDGLNAVVRVLER